MNLSSQLSQVVGFGTSLVALGGVAALFGVVTGAMFSGSSSSEEEEEERHSIPLEDLERIAKEYGWWAAKRAESFCPHNDVACVEREAKRLYETTIYRR